MKIKMGFNEYREEDEAIIGSTSEAACENKAVKSVVQVRFPSKGRSYSYYNDKFDLQEGDIVFVDGKLEGIRGIVTDVKRSFKINLSDYKRVISVANTEVKGELFFGGSNLIAFEKNVIPYEKVRGWFMPPENEEDIVSGYDDTGFILGDWKSFDAKPEVIEKGLEYYTDDKVIYLCVENNFGKAIVEGSRMYEVTFEYSSGEIKNLTCSCFCSYHCKHEIAVLMQLKETIDITEKYKASECSNIDYFAAINKFLLLSYAAGGRKNKSIIFK